MSSYLSPLTSRKLFPQRHGADVLFTRQDRALFCFVTIKIIRISKRPIKPYRRIFSTNLLFSPNYFQSRIIILIHVYSAHIGFFGAELLFTPKL